jgi:hypothetical protein
MFARKSLVYKQCFITIYERQNWVFQEKHFLKKINVKDGSKEFYMMVIIIKPS